MCDSMGSAYAAETLVAYREPLFNLDVTQIKDILKN